MLSKHALIPSKPQRLPRRGFLFTLARFAGLLLKIAGLLLLGIAVVGFVFMLVRITPTLVGSIRHLDQNMAGFIFLVSLGSLLFFPIVGLVAVAMTGIGFFLGFVGTGPRFNIDNQTESSTDKKESESSGESETGNGNA